MRGRGTRALLRAPACSSARFHCFRIALDLPEYGILAAYSSARSANGTIVPSQLTVAKSRQSPKVVPQKRTRAFHAAAAASPPGTPPALAPSPPSAAPASSTAAGAERCSRRRTRAGHHGKPGNLAQTSSPRRNGSALCTAHSAGDGAGVRMESGIACRSLYASNAGRREKFYVMLALIKFGVAD